MTSRSTATSTPGRSLKLLSLVGAFALVYYYVSTQEQETLSSLVSQTSSTTKEADSKGVIPMARLHDTATKEFILDPEQEFTPAIVWLMSFPNSGTSYTMTMVARSSTKAFATNYCDEVFVEGAGECHSIYPRRPEGPYWWGMSGIKSTPRPLPEKYVITKTHCGSRCVDCGPTEYVETPEVFLKRCASGHARVLSGGRMDRVDVDYPPERVAKAIHLIRNPYHNIIARFHLERHHRIYSNKKEWLDKHGNDKDGLQKYCKDLDQTYKKEDETYFGKGNVSKAPCHGEFYKWTQWHNLVHEGLDRIRSLHPVPVLTIYYEDYTTKFNATVADVLEFLELEHQGVLREFEARTDYDGYFTKEQQEHVKALVKKVASKKTWSDVEHYFRDV